MSCGIQSTFAQGLDLDPKSSSVDQWTCFEKFQSASSGPFEKLAARLLQAPVADEDDAAARFVLALNLRKIQSDSEYRTLEPKRQQEIQSALDGIDGASTAATRIALRAVFDLETRDSSPWFVTPEEPRNFERLETLLRPGFEDAATACIDLHERERSGGLDPGEALAGIDVDAIVNLLKSPEAILAERTRERFMEALAVAVVEANAGHPRRIEMLGTIAEAGPCVRELNGVSLPRFSRAFDTLLKEAPDLEVTSTLERFRRLRELSTRAKMPLPMVDHLKLIKPLKPAYPQIAPLFRQTQKSIAPVVVRLLDSGESLNDPAVMKADEPFLGVVSDMNRLTRISSGMCQPDSRGVSVIREECKFAAARILDSVKRIARAKEDGREDRINEFRALCSLIELSLPNTGDQICADDGDPNIGSALNRFDGVKREYLQALSNPRRVPEPKLVQALQAGAAVFKLKDRASIHDPSLVLAWPGVEISPDIFHALGESLNAQISALFEDFAAARDERVVVRIREIEQRYAAALALADLARALALSGIAPGGAIDELTANHPDTLRVIGARHLESFLYISLCAEEIASLRAAGQDTKALEERMNERALTIRLESET